MKTRTKIDPVKMAELYAEGLTDLQIAERLGYAPGTVSNWRRGKGYKPNRKYTTATPDVPQVTECEPEPETTPETEQICKGLERMTLPALAKVISFSAGIYPGNNFDLNDNVETYPSGCIVSIGFDADGEPDSCCITFC